MKKMFKPLNRHLEVEPIQEEAYVSDAGATFEEKGKILSYANDCRFVWELGKTVYFDSFLVAKYNDSEGKMRYLVPEEAIRAYED